MAAEVHQEGLQWEQEVAYSEEQSVPANFYIGLCTDASLAETASLGDQTEVSGTSYARQAVASSAVGFTSATAGTNDRKVTTTEVTYTAGGTWTGAQTAFLATTIDDTGVLLWSAPLSTTITLPNLGTLSFTMAYTIAG